MASRTLSAVLAVTLASTAACTFQADGRSAPTAEPTQPATEEAVRAAAKEHFDAYSAGNYGAVWDTWTHMGKSAISREDYARLWTLCRDPGAGVAFTILKVTLGLDRTFTYADVRVQRLISITEFRWYHEVGVWRFHPKPEALALYKLGSPERIAEAAISQRKCVNPSPSTAGQPS